MSTIIKFSGSRDDTLLVIEEIEDVTAKFAAADGRPVQLTRNIGTPVFVNPQRVAFWHPYRQGNSAWGSPGGEPS